MRLDPDAPDPANPADLENFLGALFDGVEWQPGQRIALRGLGEKGTPQQDVFREQAWAAPEGAPARDVLQHADRWNGAGAGAFIIPAVMAAGAQNIGRQGRQTEGDVAAFTSVCLDLDNPDTAEDSLLRLEHALGPAGIIVESSSGKLHAYWLLVEPEEDVQRVARLRHLLALKSGGDPSFQRVPQVIRLPGTMHGKGGVLSPVVLRHADTRCRHMLSGLEERVEAMHPLPWASAEATRRAAQGGLNLAALADGLWTARERLTADVHEGGQGVATRFDAATQVFGHYVHSVRTGAVATVEEARDLAHGWMLAHMIPPWPEDRFDREWGAIVALDAERHGPLVAPGRLYGTGEVGAPVPLGAGERPPIPDEGLKNWAVRRWVTTEEPPKRAWLVQGLIRAGAAHLLASEGGVGKTFALLDLCAAVATGPDLSPTWLGQDVVREHTGGTAVLLTAEDDQDELHIRLFDMDAQGRRFAAQDRMIVIPLVQAGGVFPLVELGVGGVMKPSAAWERMMAGLSALPNLQLVAIDTLAATLHGEENSSIIIQQYITALNMLRAKVPAVATVVTHHVRKQGTKDQPILSAADMRQAIRGSNALLGAVRMALGIWQPADWADRQKRMGMTPAVPGRLFHLAVVKANNPEAMADTRTLVRAAHGGLEDATARDRATRREDEVYAWLVAAVERAVAAGRPYTKTGVGGLAGDRQGELPPDLPGQKALRLIVDAMVNAGKLVVGKVGGKEGLLDVPGGLLAGATEIEPYQLRAGAHEPDWGGWTFNRMLGLAQPGG